MLWGTQCSAARRLPWLCVVLTPLPAAGAVRLVPVVDLAQVLDGHPLTAFFQIVGNLLVFAAFGLLAPVRWRVGPVAVMAVVAAASTTAETLRHVLTLGRVSSIDDVCSTRQALASPRCWTDASVAAATVTR